MENSKSKDEFREAVHQPASSTRNQNLNPKKNLLKRQNSSDSNCAIDKKQCVSGDSEIKCYETDSSLQMETEPYRKTMANICGLVEQSSSVRISDIETEVKIEVNDVKSMLKHEEINNLSNKNILNMVEKTMTSENEKVDKEAEYEPKFTRSKVKELQEQTNIYPLPMSNSVKLQSATQSFLNEVLSDSECASDEDYIPDKKQLCQENEAMHGPDPILDNSVDDEPRLVIVLPEEQSLPHTDVIACRTRSKHPLNDTPLEVIESTSILPDIRLDLYENNCEDVEWSKFLQEFYQPLDHIINADPEDPNDPEFIALDDEDLVDEDFCFEEIPQDELDALVSEVYSNDESLIKSKFEEEHHEKNFEANTFEIANRSVNDVTSANESSVSVIKPGIQDKHLEIKLFTAFNPVEVASSSTAICDLEKSNIITMPTVICDLQKIDNSMMSCLMTFNDRLRLASQMRQFVQLNTQFYLLSRENPDLSFLSSSSKHCLTEIKEYAKASIHGRNSAFYASNLDGAVKIIDNFESQHIVSSRIIKGISNPVKKILFESDVFMYPQLLPKSTFKTRACRNSPNFTIVEDNLLALGLEKFSSCPSPITYIRQFLLPNRSEGQIKGRIRNCKYKYSLKNPVKYYLVHKRARAVPSLLDFFGCGVGKPPKDMPNHLLPEWMRKIKNKNVVHGQRTVRNEQYRRILQYRRISPCPFVEESNNLIHARPLSTKNDNSTNMLNEDYNSDHLNCQLDEVQQASTTKAAALLEDCREILKKSDEELLQDKTEIKKLQKRLQKLEDLSEDKGFTSVSDRPAAKSDIEVVLQEHNPGQDLFVDAFLLRTSQALDKEPGLFQIFLKLLSDLQNEEINEIKLYEDTKDILKKYPALLKDFAGFLSEDAAERVGILRDWIKMKKIVAFLSHIQAVFRYDVEHLTKILHSLAAVNTSCSIASFEALNDLKKLLNEELTTELNSWLSEPSSSDKVSQPLILRFKK